LDEFAVIKPPLPNNFVVIKVSYAQWLVDTCQFIVLTKALDTIKKVLQITNMVVEKRGSYCGRFIIPSLCLRVVVAKKNIGGHY
jgi:hypothetical protein